MPLPNRFLVIILCAAIAISSCTMHMSGEPTINEQLLVQLTDSLNKDSTAAYRIQVDSIEHVAWSAVVNNTRMAILLHTDSTLQVLKFTGSQWTGIDSMPFTDYVFDVEASDLNGDGKTDLIVKGFPNMHGQCETYVWMTDQGGNWKYRPTPNLYNLRYNKQTGYVESFYEGGVRSIHSKEMHKWVADTLQLVKRAELDFSDEKQIYTRMYEYQNGKEVKTLELSGENNIYDTLLFRIID